MAFKDIITSFQFEHSLAIKCARTRLKNKMKPKIYSHQSCKRELGKQKTKAKKKAARRGKSNNDNVLSKF